VLAQRFFQGLEPRGDVTAGGEEQAPTSPSGGDGPRPVAPLSLLFVLFEQPLGHFQIADGHEALDGIGDAWDHPGFRAPHRP
jgi:hypothetical protein